MVDAYLRRSPLAHRGLPARAQQDAARRADAGIVLSERPHRCQVNLRGKAADPVFLARVLSAIGLNLPTVANTTTSDGGITALWLGPDEWLVVAVAGREAELAAGLRQVLAGQHFSVVDLSEARTVLIVTGRRAREVLQKGTPMDLHPRLFQTGHCAQTALTKANVILHQTSDDPRYEIYATISFADYLWNWFERAADEYGLAVIDV